MEKRIEIQSQHKCLSPITIKAIYSKTFGQFKFCPTIYAVKETSMSEFENNKKQESCDYDNQKNNSIDPHSKALLTFNTIDHQNGWTRVKNIFSRDDFEELSPQVQTIAQSLTMGLVVGGIYGAAHGTRGIYENFVRQNQTAIYTHTREAQRRLQDTITLNMMKGAWKWGWRTSVFTGLFFLVFHVVSAYRNKTGILSFMLAGGTAGSVYRINRGMKGVLGGTLVGTILGMIAGGMSLSILYFSGHSFDELQKDYAAAKYAQRRERIEGSETDPLLSHSKLLKNLEEEKSIK